MDMDALKDSANKIRAKRLKQEYSPIVGSRVSDIVLAAQKIKESRESKLEPNKPLPVQKFAHIKNAFVCKDVFGIEVRVIPSNHSIEQFIKRFPYANRLVIWDYTSDNFMRQVVNTMREIFNSGKIKENIDYIKRHQKYRNTEVISWGTDKINFIVDVAVGEIITTELCGELTRYN